MERFDSQRALADLHAKSFDRTLVALAVAKRGIGADHFATAKVDRGGWRDTPTVPALVNLAVDDLLHMKAASGAVALDSSWTSAVSAFLAPLRRESIVGRLTGARRRPVQASTLAKIVGAGAAWVREGASIPIHTGQFDFATMMPLKVAGMVVATNEFIQFAARNDEAAEQLSADLREAAREQLDATFAGSAAAVTGESPAGIGATATTVSSTGSTVAQIAADLRSMIAVLVNAGVSLRSAQWIMSEPAYALFRLLKVTDDSGTLAGLPVLASGGAAGAVMLVAAEHVQITLADVATITASGEGAVEMDDAPTHDSVTPTETQLVSMFQTNSVALRTVLYANWQLGGPTDSAGDSLAVVRMEPPYA